MHKQFVVGTIYILMRKDKLYFLTFISISIIFLITSSIAIKYFVKVSANQLIELELESSIRECKEISKLTSYYLESGIEKKKVTDCIQQTIQNATEETSFVSVFDWSGKEVCHPDITQIGQKVNSNQTLLNSLKEEDSSDHLYDLLMLKQDEKNKDGKKINSEIIHISPVNNSDLIVAAYVNLDKFRVEINKLKKSFYTIFILMGVLVILSSFFAVRIIGSYYEKQLEVKNSNLENELVNLSKLNSDLSLYQQKVLKDKTDEVKEETIQQDTSKKRILTHIRNELVPIEIDQIAYVYTENTITFVVSLEGKKSTTNTSLDDLFMGLDSSLFFRANRQFIISITSIDKIIKYGNSQLKILVRQGDDVEIIISKNKAAEFRQWLNI